MLTMLTDEELGMAFVEAARNLTTYGEDHFEKCKEIHTEMQRRIENEKLLQLAKEVVQIYGTFN